MREENKKSDRSVAISNLLQDEDVRNEFKGDIEEAFTKSVQSGVVGEKMSEIINTGVLNNTMRDITSKQWTEIKTLYTNLAELSTEFKLLSKDVKGNGIDGLIQKFEKLHNAVSIIQISLQDAVNTNNNLKKEISVIETSYKTTKDIQKGLEIKVAVFSGIFTFALTILTLYAKFK